MGMEGGPQEKRQRSKNEVMAEIHALAQQEMTRGAVDVEASAFANILDRLDKNELTPDEALAEAKDITERRQDYH